MDVMAAIQGRRSIRNYSTREVEEEKLNRVLEAARLAPSANNRQNWRFIVVRDEELRKKMTEASFGQQFVGGAPVVIVACGTDPSGVMRCGQYRYTIDLSIAVSYMTLEAYEQGLGTCWIGSFDEGMVKKLLNIPDTVRAVAITPLGYPAESPAPRPRKSLSEIVCYDKYQE
ncbi:MAG TPA: nitroreductase family protein [Clostridiales bacterium]|nr:nitroreductase family protein [Clostridiales bacterium]